MFARSEDRRHVIDQVTPGCEWVLAGEGRATRKWDGTCVMFDGDRWWARREVKMGKRAPSAWRQVTGLDPVTKKWVGWEPAEDSPFVKYLAEAVADRDEWEIGTYELCGPKINGNPEQMGAHTLFPHGAATLKVHPAFLELQCFLRDDYPHLEGVVWWHPDGRKAKIKRRDFQ